MKFLKDLFIFKLPLSAYTFFILLASLIIQIMTIIESQKNIKTLDRIDVKIKQASEIINGR